MEKILGKCLRDGQKTVETLSALQDTKFIAIYFGAHWAPPCRLFTKTLTEFYGETNKDKKQVEVVFVSLDGNNDAFERNYAEMSWLAVPYEDEKLKSMLKQRFAINSIPTMVIVDGQGNQVTFDGRKDIQKDPSECLKWWDDELKANQKLQQRNE